MRASNRATQQAGRAVLTLLTARSPIAKVGAVVILVTIGWAAWQKSNGGTTTADHIVGEVVAVADGDTVTVLDDAHKQHRIRLAFVDAPEKSQPYGQAAKQALSDKVYRRTVTVDVVDQDRYGRTVGRLEVGDQDINLSQVEAGYAWHYRQYAERNQPRDAFDRYEAAQSQARGERRGLWQDSDPTPPWAYRHKARNDNG